MSRSSAIASDDSIISSSLYSDPGWGNSFDIIRITVETVTMHYDTYAI